MSRNRKKRAVNRREFINALSGGTVGVGLGYALTRGTAAPKAEPELERRNEQPDMVYTRFGRTNLHVSRLAFGGNQLQRDNVALLEMAVERGVNLVHMADAYRRGESMAVLGAFLKKPGNRDKVWVCLKGAHGKGVPESIDGHLRVLNTDHVDIIACPIFEPDVIRKDEGQKEKFEALKKAGKVRFLNLTTHSSLEKSMAAGVDAGWFSSVLSVIDLTNVAQFRPVLQRAKAQNVAVMAMKSMRNRRAGDPEKIARALFAAGVTTILKSQTTRAGAEQWLQAVPKVARQISSFVPDGAGDGVRGMCMLCGTCEGCPNGVATQDIVRDFTYYVEQQGAADVAAERYAELHPGALFPSCRDCGRCEERCPNGVAIRRIVREAHERLGAKG